MAKEKNIQSRIQHKHDVETNWIKATAFIPLAGEIIIYDKDDNYDYERFKIGDGVTLVNDLPFTHQRFLTGESLDIIDIYVCSDDEHSFNGTPIIDSPSKNTAYLVPQDDDGYQYAEWVYADDKWEFVEILTFSLEDADKGLSAYEIAIENGFKGSIQEWLDSLKGADGKTPVKGVDYFTSEDIQETAQLAADLMDISSEIMQDQEFIDLLVNEDMLPAITSSDGSILSDKNDIILSW